MKEKSFTLIELLVVIAIVGLLSSIVLVSMKGVREKARIAKGLEFSQTVQHTLGAYAVGWWSFETIEQPGNKVIDGSGYDNHGTVNGATLVLGLEQLGNALSFNGSSNYVNVGNAASLNPAYITLEAWIKPNNLLNGAIAKRESGYTFFESGNDWLSINGAWSYRYNINTSITNNVWQHVILTYDGLTSKAYVNGVLVASGAITGTLTQGSTAVTSVGSADYSRPFNGLIDEVRIYERALSVAEIQKHYAEGLEGHQNLAVE